jgi:arylsulfatase
MMERVSRNVSISRREFIRSVAAAGASALAARSLGQVPGHLPDRSASRPNIVLIFPDEWRWDALGTLGLLPVQTPNLDAIATHSVIFSNCYTCGPVCMTARASLMTGQYVHEHGQWDNDTPARDPASPSHVRRMRDEAGYQTALIGKAHLHGEEVSVQDGRPTLNQWGFSYTNEMTGPEEFCTDDTASWCQWIGPEKLACLRAYIKNFKANNKRHDPWGTEPIDIAPWDLTSADHWDTYLGDQAAQWIRDAGGTRPFYLQVNFPGPHYPQTSTTDFRKLFRVADMGLGIYEYPQEPLPPLVAFSGAAKCSIHGMTEQQMRQMRLIYFANQAMIDVGIGKIRRALADCGLDDNTWIFFCSDHGEMLGDHFLMYKSVFYESSAKVPLLVRPPQQAVAAGWVATGLTDHLDLATTILDLAGLTPMFANRGASLLPQVVAGPDGAGAQQGREQVISEILYDSSVRQLMLRTKTHKMNVQLNSPVEPVELYDLVQDPTECQNLVRDPAHQSVCSDMLDRIDTFLADTNYEGHGLQG